MNELIKVKINPDGITAKEINAFEKPELFDSCLELKQCKYEYPIGYDLEQYEKDLKEWEKAEAKLRTFEIEKSIYRSTQTMFVAVSKKIMRPREIWEAEILENGKIRIL